MTTAFTTNTQSNAGGVINHKTGVAVTTSAGATDTTFNIGFVPRIIRWINVTDGIMHEWYEGMATDSAIKTAANGTRSLESSNGLTVVSDAPRTLTSTGGAGFTVAAEVIVASKSHVWEAIG